MVMGSLRQETEVAIVGAGPGGYVAALRAADLGHEVMLIEQRQRPGGVCLLEGCIPSKSLIHAVELANAARDAGELGLTFSDLKVDPAVLRGWTDKVVAGLARGIEGLLARRGVEMVHGRARFDGQGSLRVDNSEVSGVDFRHAIVATGSSVNEIPAAHDLPVWSSADALKLPGVPESLLVVGGGYIGLELGLVYAGLGSRVSLVEFFPRLLTGADPDLVKVVLSNCERRFEALKLESRVSNIEHHGGRFEVAVEHHGETVRDTYDQVLVAVGRRPNTDDLGLENIGVTPDHEGRIPVNPQMRTAAPGVFAIGDVAPGPMLAHKASREARVAAEVIGGLPSALDNRAIPAVVFTDPEIAWTGLTEQEANHQGRPLKVGRFPLSALGRARTMGRTEGLFKVLSDPETDLVLGVGIAGPHASELIAEATLAVEMGATLEDLMVTIHPHPTLSEALMEAAEVAAGQPIHVPPKKVTKR